ncbi:MAG: IPT/TIG domain-containing protein [Candidatus Melainabacteria bacterium]|nr:IPT/TIG domain-containing protein [Candidatus Melainabacteria bacterium]
MANTFFLILVFILVLCYPYYSVAFVIPDVNNIGKDPKIYSVSPRYLIPGDRVKIIGENFLASPKTANKLFINGKKVRILSATNNELEFIVPKLPLGEGKIVLFTHYLGLKSQEEIYPNHSTNGFYITFKAPEVLGVNSIEVKPNQKLTVFGNFNLKKEVYFKLDNGIFKGKIFSNRSAELVLPDKLPLAPIPLKMFYRKTVLKKGTQLFFDSAFSDDLTLYNIEFGEPQYLNISIENSVFDVIPDKELSYRVELIYGNGKKTDVTDFVAIEMIGDEIAKIDKVNKKLKVHAGGIVTLKAMFLWEPISKMLEDTQDIVVNLPRYPYFHEVVIDEIFPFASGFFSETDANGDGFAKLNDEFIELKNLTGETLDLSNCKFYINEKKEASVVLSDLTVIKPYEYFVIYGDMAEEDSLNLSNSGAVVELIWSSR